MDCLVHSDYGSV